MPAPNIFLVDNGSLRPEATFALRRLAGRLSDLVGMQVEPVSLLHAHKIDAAQLGGVPATIVKRRMRELIQDGEREFIILPLFLGPSLAITDYLPAIIEELRRNEPCLDVKIADPVGGSSVESPDPRLSRILAEHIESMACDKEAHIALVDHGTPIKPVNTLRNAVAQQLADRLGQVVRPCSMERRKGPDYAFNEPLLEDLVIVDGISNAQLILAMFFLLPGRHAGEGGDVAEIAEAMVERRRVASVQMSPLLGEHPLLLEILRERLDEVRKS